MKCDEQAKLPTQMTCDRCKYVSSQPLCKACVLLEGLNRGLPRLGIGKSSRVKRLLVEDDEKNNASCQTKDKCCGKGGCERQQKTIVNGTDGMTDVNMKLSQLNLVNASSDSSKNILLNNIDF